MSVFERWREHARIKDEDMYDQYADSQLERIFHSTFRGLTPRGDVSRRKKVISTLMRRYRQSGD